MEGFKSIHQNFSERIHPMSDPSDFQGFGADGGGEGDLEVWFGIDLGVMDCTAG